MVHIFKNKMNIGFVIGIIVAAVIWNANMNNISPEGQKALALSLMAVVFWATKVTNVGFVSIL